MIALNLADLVLSYFILDPQTEANPIMRRLWVNGYVYVIIFKVLTVLFVLGCLSLMNKKRVRLTLIIINLILCFTCARRIQFHVVKLRALEEIHTPHYFDYGYPRD